MSWWIALALQLAMSAPAARLVDPGVLRAPVTFRDPLAVPKRLWHRGVRGPLFEVDRRFELDSGYYLLPENWNRLEVDFAPGLCFLWDRPLLRRLQSLAAEGVQIVVHARVPTAAFAVNTDNTFYGVVAPLVPRLARGPYIGINGFTSQYMLEHELRHHADHESGFADATWSEVQSVFASHVRPGQKLEPIWFFMFEARAHQREFIALYRATRPFELQGSADGTEFTDVSRVGGRAYRVRRRAQLVRDMNRIYAAALDQYSSEARILARKFFRRNVDDYERWFDGEDRMRSPCELELVTHS